MRLRFVLTVLGMFVLFTFAAAEVPHIVNYQGRLTVEAGSPVTDGYYNLTFTIYDDPTEVSGHALWSSGIQSGGGTQIRDRDKRSETSDD